MYHPLLMYRADACTLSPAFPRDLRIRAVRAATDQGLKAIAAAQSLGVGRTALARLSGGGSLMADTA
jgi:hypothetical protein